MAVHFSKLLVLEISIDSSTENFKISNFKSIIQNNE